MQGVVGWDVVETAGEVIASRRSESADMLSCIWQIVDVDLSDCDSV